MLLLHLQHEAQRHAEPQREQEPEAWPWWKRLRKGGDDDEESMRTLPPNAALPPAVAWPSTVVIADVDSSPRSGPLRDQAAARLRSAEEEIRGMADGIDFSR